MGDLSSDDVDPNSQNPVARQLVFDVTGLVTQANSRPTGIERVMLEIALSLAQRDDPAVKFCAFDDHQPRFESVSVQDVVELGRRMRGSSEQGPVQEAPPVRASTRRSRFQRRLAVATPHSSPHVQAAFSHLGSASREARAAISGSLATPPTKLGRGQTSTGCCSEEWTSTTTFCSIDPVFATALPSYLAQRRAKTGFRIALMIHDLIPWIAPHYVTWDDSSAAAEATEIADILIVNSDATRIDLESFASHHRLQPAEIVKLPMASALRGLEYAGGRPLGEEIGLTNGNYVLCVGSVTIRKNHRLLLDVWELLVQAAGITASPRLVFAGRLGWLCDETVARLRLTPGLKGIVHHVPDASDEEVAWLYRHCAFTVFPSLYEGWGLPVSESLDFGKVCLTSDSSSLPEAGDGVAELLDPTDRSLWLERVLLYWTDSNARMTQERRIAAGHRRITPQDAAGVIQRVAGLP